MSGKIRINIDMEQVSDLYFDVILKQTKTKKTGKNIIVLKLMNSDLHY